MAESYCPDCKTATQVVFDHSAGDRICSECALVLELHSVDETSEWRNFNDDSGSKDAARAGDKSNPLLDDGGLSVSILRGNDCKGKNELLSFTLSRRQEQSRNARLLEAFKEIAIMGDRLGLVSTITDRANELFKQVVDQSRLKGRNLNTIYAGCLYIACRFEDKPRSIKEIMFAANIDSKKDLGRAKEFISKLLDVGTGGVQASDYMKRFCCYVGLNNQAIKAAQAAVREIEKLDIRRNASAVAAAIIHIICEASGDRKTFKEISTSTGVPESTLRNAHRDLYPHTSIIVPTWFIKQQEQIHLYDGLTVKLERLSSNSL